MEIYGRKENHKKRKMKEPKSLGETKRKEKISKKEDSLRNSKIRKCYNEELKKLGKKQNEAEIVDEHEIVEAE